MRLLHCGKFNSKSDFIYMWHLEGKRMKILNKGLPLTSHIEVVRFAQDNNFTKVVTHTHVNIFDVRGLEVQTV